MSWRCPSASYWSQNGWVLQAQRLPYNNCLDYAARMHRRIASPFLFLIVFVFLLSGVCAASPIQERADRFLKLANAGYQALSRVNSQAQWLAVTDVTPEHDAAVAATGKAYPTFNGHSSMIT